MANRWAKRKQRQIVFSWALKSLLIVTATMKLRHLPLESASELWFFRSYIWMRELDQKESWAPKNWCFQTVVLEKTLKSPLDSKEMQPVNPKGNQPWILTRRTEAKAPILWPHDVTTQLPRKDLDAGIDGGQEGKRLTEAEMVGWHHWLNGHEFEKTPGDNEGQGSLVCCSPRGCKQLDKTEPLNNYEMCAVVFLFVPLFLWVLWNFPFYHHMYEIWLSTIFFVFLVFKVN